MERLIMLLQEDDDICLDALVNEQLLHFYQLQPSQGTVASNFYVVERNQNLTEANNQRGPTDLSFGNERCLKFLIEPTNIKSAEDDIEQPRTLEDLPSKNGSPIKPAAEFFKIKNEPTIIPDKHAKEQTIQIRVPHSILKDSNNGEYDSLGSVFQSELNTNRGETNRQKKVEFQE